MEYVINKHTLPNKRAEYVDQAEAMGLGGWFSNFKRRLKQAAGAIIVGVASGGGIGMAVGLVFSAAIMAAIDTIGEDDGSLMGASLGFTRTGTITLPTRTTTKDLGGLTFNPTPLPSTTINIDPIQSEEDYPLTAQEEDALFGWFTDLFFPTLGKLSHKIDATIEASIGSRTTVDTVLVKCNEVLEAIAVFRAHNTLISAKGLKTKLGIKAGDSNFVRNRVVISEEYLVMLEKSVLQYMEEQRAGQYTLVTEQFVASNTTLVETVPLAWQSQTISGNKKTYVANDQVVNVTTQDPETGEEVVTVATPDNPKGGAVEITVVDTDPKDLSTPTTNLPAEYENMIAAEEPLKDPSAGNGKALAIFGLSALTLAYLFGRSGDEKNTKK